MNVIEKRNLDFEKRGQYWTEIKNNKIPGVSSIFDLKFEFQDQ